MKFSEVQIIFNPLSRYEVIVRKFETIYEPLLMTGLLSITRSDISTKSFLFFNPLPNANDSHQKQYTEP